MEWNDRKRSQKNDHPGYPSLGKSPMGSCHRGGTFNLLGSRLAANPRLTVAQQGFYRNKKDAPTRRLSRWGRDARATTLSGDRQGDAHTHKRKIRERT